MTSSHIRAAAAAPAARRARSRPRGGRVIAACATFGLVLLAALPAAGQEPAPTAEELGLSVVVGYGSRAGTSSWLPVEVTVEPARALEAEISVLSRSGGGPVAEVRSIEAAARTRRVHRFLVPAGPVAVRVVEAGRLPLEVRARPETRERGFAVAVLGEVPEGVPALRSEPSRLTGSWVGIDPGWLELGPAALEPVAVLVADVAELAGLSPSALAAVRAAVTGGTDLVVVAGRPGALPDLGLDLPAGSAAATAGGALGLAADPGAWAVTSAQVGDAGEERVVAARGGMGRGSITVVSVLPGEGDLGRSEALWSLLVGPSDRTGVTQNEWAVDQLPHQFMRLFTGGDATAPTLPWLALFTIAYVVVVGPLNGMVLARMGRRELAWVTVPIVTAVFTAGAFVGVTGNRPAMGLAGRVLVSVEGSGTEIVALAVRAPTAGERRISLHGDGWTVRTLGESGTLVALRRDADVEAVLDLAALQMGGMVARRPVEESHPLEVDAVSGSQGVAIRVRNAGGTPIERVVVRAATALRSVGDLAPGEELEVEIPGDLLPTVPPHRDAFDGIFAGAPASLEVLLRDQLIDGSPGMVWAVGTQPRGSVGALVEGTRPEDRGLLLAAGTRPARGDALGPFAVERDLIVTNQQSYRPSPLAVDGVNEAFVRFRLPAGADVGRLRDRLEPPQEFGDRPTVSIWVPADRAWRPVEEAFGPEGGDPAVLLDPLGTLWVRVEGELYPFDTSGLSIDAIPEVGP